MGDELFLRSRCTGGAGCHCAGMEHFYVPESSDHPPHNSSKARRTSNLGGGARTDIVHPASVASDTVPVRRGAAAGQAGGATPGRPTDGRRSRRARPPAHQSTPLPAAGGDSSLSEYLAYSSDEEFEEFIKRPRTDYTYARSISYTALSPQRVGPPSMSRLGLRSPADSPAAGRWRSGARRDGQYEQTATQVYNYRREITSRVTSPDLPSKGALYGISPGLDMDSGDEEWLPTDKLSERFSARHETFRLKAGRLLGRASTLLLSPLAQLWLLLAAVCRRLLAAVRRPVRPAETPLPVPAGPSSRLESGARHRYRLRPRATPQPEPAGVDPALLRPAAGAQAATAAAPAARLNPLRWPAAAGAALAAAGRALSPISWARSTAEVPGAPRRAATVSGWLGPAGRPGGWLRSAGLLLFGPAGGAAAAEQGPAPVGRASSWGLSDALSSDKAAAGGWRTAEMAGRGGRRRWCLPLVSALLLLLLLLLLLPVIWRSTREDGGRSSEDWWPLPPLEPLGARLAGGLSSEDWRPGLAAAGSRLYTGLQWVGGSTAAAAQLLWAQLAAVAGSVATLWPSTPAESSSAPPPPSVPGPALTAVYSQLSELRQQLDTLRGEYQTCRSAADGAAGPAAVRAALGLPPNSAAPPTAGQLAAAERRRSDRLARLERRLAAELAAVRARLDGPDRPADEPAAARLAARLAALQEVPAAAERLRQDGDAAASRLHALDAELGRLRTDIDHLHRTLLTVQESLQQERSCCNRTDSDWSGQLSEQLQQLQHQLDDRVRVYAATLRQDLSSEVASLAGAGGGGGGGISRQEALSIAQHELALYDADKTGQFDYALESAGGSVVSTKCTEPYSVRSAQLTVLGIPLWYPANNPRAIIQPSMRPGECFAFRGEGVFVVSLSRPVWPTEFVVEHISRDLTPGGRIDSAPRDFAVLGVLDELEPAVPLGRFTYQEAGPPLQRFAAAPAAGRALRAVELRVTSNWGHPNYTCLYRFRVHGRPAPEQEQEQEQQESDGGR